MYGRISSTLPYHTRAGSTRILPILTTQIQVLPYSNHSIHPTDAQCFTISLLKPFRYPTHNPLLTSVE